MAENKVEVEVVEVEAKEDNKVVGLVKKGGRKIKNVWKNHKKGIICVAVTTVGGGVVYKIVNKVRNNDEEYDYDDEYDYSAFDDDTESYGETDENENDVEITEF